MLKVHVFIQILSERIRMFGLSPVVEHTPTLLRVSRRALNDISYLSRKGLLFIATSRQYLLRKKGILSSTQKSDIQNVKNPAEICSTNAPIRGGLRLCEDQLRIVLKNMARNNWDGWIKRVIRRFFIYIALIYCSISSSHSTKARSRESLISNPMWFVLVFWHQLVKHILIRFTSNTGGVVN